MMYNSSLNTVFGRAEYLRYTLKAFNHNSSSRFEAMPLQEKTKCMQSHLKLQHSQALDSYMLFYVSQGEKSRLPSYLTVTVDKRKEASDTFECFPIQSRKALCYKPSLKKSFYGSQTSAL